MGRIVGLVFEELAEQADAVARASLEGLADLTKSGRSKKSLKA